MSFVSSRSGRQPDSPLALNFRRQNATNVVPTSGQKPAQMWSNGRKSFPSWTCERFDRFCRDRFPRATEHHLSALAGIPAATVRKHMTGAAKPGADAMLAYVSVFGPELLAAMMPACDWAERAAHDETRRQIRNQLERIGERL